MKKIILALAISLMTISFIGVSNAKSASAIDTPTVCAQGTHGQWCYYINDYGNYIYSFVVSMHNETGSNYTIGAKDECFFGPLFTKTVNVCNITPITIKPGTTETSNVGLNYYVSTGIYCIQTDDNTPGGDLCLSVNVIE